MTRPHRRRALAAGLAALAVACCLDALMMGQGAAQQQGPAPPSAPTVTVPISLVPGSLEPNGTFDVGTLPIDARRLTTLLIVPSLIQTGDQGLGAGLGQQARVQAYLSDLSAVDVTAALSGTTYSVDDSTVATVSPDGLVTPVGFGTTVIHAFNHGVQTSAFVLVDNEFSETSLAVSGLTLGFVGAQGQLQMVANESDGFQNDVTLTRTTYQSDAPWVAQVDPNGLVTAVGAGSADIAVSHGLLFASAPISVVIAASSVLVDLNLSSLPSAVRSSAPIQSAVTGINADGSSVNLTSPITGTTYQTSAATVAVVTADGIVTPVGNGAARITAANSGLSASQNLLVSFSALQSLTMTPASATIPVNPANPLSIRQLKVQGLYSDGTFSDLTSSATGTTYQTSNPVSANPGPSGMVAFTQPGQATITASNAGVSASAQFTVTDFNPAFLGFYPQAGLTNVAVSSKTVYLTAGGGGLQVIDASNAAFLNMVSSAATPGNMVDVAVSAGRAYVAETSGLAVFDVSNPAAPGRLSTIPGSSVQGVAVAGGLLYFVDGQTLNIYDATALTPVGALSALPGTGQAVSVSGGLAFIAAGAAGLDVVDVSTPSAPVLAANVPLPSPAFNVASQNRLAFVPGNSGPNAGQVSVVDATVPAGAAVAGQTSPIAANGVALRGNLMLVAEQSYSRQIPLLDIATPQSPVLVGFIPAPGKSSGRRVAISGGVLYEIVGGNSGNQGLAAALFAPAEPPNPPTVSLTSPAAGAAYLEGAAVPVAAAAAADTAVSSVTFFLNGVAQTVASVPPYNAAVQIPPGTAGTSFVISAQAEDVSGYLSAISSATVQSAADLLTTVQGQLLDVSSNPVAGASITLAGSLQTVSGADGSFYVTHVPTILGQVTLSSTATVSGFDVFTSAQLPPVAGGVTDFGPLTMKGP